MIGQEMWFTPDHLPGTSIKIETIEQNTRFPMVLRFNHDNNFAHRIDAVIYLGLDGEPLNPFEIKQSPVRFVRMPYYVSDRIPLIWDTKTERLVYCGAKSDRELAIAESLVPDSIREIIKEIMGQDPAEEDPNDGDENDDDPIIEVDDESTEE